MLTSQGVVFSGTVHHAGKRVSAGLGYVLVASFTITGEGKNEEFCIKNDEFRIKHDELCIKNDA